MSYHFNLTFVSRGKGQSIVAKGAYQQRAKFTEERTGELKDYSRDGDKPKATLLFVHKSQQEKHRGAEALLNAIDKAETRKDAQTGLNFIAALPSKELLTDEERARMVRDFGREQFLRQSIPAIASLHAPSEKGDERNEHVHILAGTRKLDAEGFASKKYITWDNYSQQLQIWREKWAELGARYLEKAGHQIEADRWRYGHLTNEQQRDKAIERGDSEWAEMKDREASKHRGPHVDAMEKKGIETERGNIHRDTYAQNESVSELKATLENLNKEIAQEQQRSTARGEQPEPSKGTAREIWDAYHHSDSPRAFVAALAERGLHLSVVTAADRPEPKEQRDPRDELAQLLSMKANGVWMMAGAGAAELTEKQRDSAERSYDNYQHQHDEHPRLNFAEYVAHVQEQNAERLEALEQQCAILPAKDRQAQTEQQHAAVYAKAGTWVVINERGYLYYLNERTTGDHARDVQEFLNNNLNSEAFFSVSDTRERIAAQAGWKQHSIDGADLKGPSRDIWEACQQSRNGRELADELMERGILIARVTREDAQQSQLANENAKTRGYRATVMQEGEFVAVTRSGDVHRFTDRNTGGRLAEITGFMQQLPADAVLSVSATRDIMRQIRHSEAMERATRPTGKPWQMGLDNAPLPKALVSQLRSVAFRGIEAAAQIFGAAMEGIGNFFGATAMTPERIDAAREQRKQQGFKNEDTAAKQEKIDVERFRRDGDYRREVQAREREKLEQDTRKYYEQQKDRDRDRR